MYELKESDFVFINNKLCFKMLDKPVLLFIYSNNCIHCKDFYNIFLQLLQSSKNVVFATLNISSYPNIVKYSEKTKFKIEYVPLLLFYYNKEPIRQFKDKRTYENISKFLNETVKLLTVSSNKTNNIKNMNNNEININNYEDNTESYMTLDRAYKKFE